MLHHLPEELDQRPQNTSWHGEIIWHRHENNIHNELEIFCCVQQKAAAKTDLLQMVFKISEKRRAELIRSAWRVENSCKNQQRLAVNTLYILDETKYFYCDCSKWVSQKSCINFKIKRYQYWEF